MLNELDKTIARMGAYITALEQTLQKVQSQLDLVTKDRSAMIDEIAAGVMPRVVQADANKKVNSGTEPEHGPVSGPASD